MRYLLLAFLYLISLIPYWLLYLKSDFIAFLLRNLFHYRDSIITKNVKQAFPGISEKKLSRIKKEYYRSFVDVMLESIKMLTMKEKHMWKSISFVEDHDYQKFINEPKGAVMLCGHRGNFELGGQMFGLLLNLPVFGAYKPFRSEAFEFVWGKVRNRFRAKAIPVKSILRIGLKHAESGFYMGFLNDQTPPRGSTSVWVHFLNKETLFFTGPEKMIRKLNIPVYFADMIRIKRGFYRLTVELISQNPAVLAEDEITVKYASKLEKAIHEQPYNWLWSHRRWKHERVV